MVSSSYLLQPTLNQFPSAPEGSIRDVCRFNAIQAHISDLLPKCNPAVEHSANRHLPATSWQFQDTSQQFPFHLCTGPFLTSALHCFCPKLLSIVCCTTFSIHICLFTRGAMLLKIKSAPLLVEDKMKKSNCSAYYWKGYSLYLNCRHWS